MPTVLPTGTPRWLPCSQPCSWCWLVWLILGNQLGNLSMNVVQKALDFVVSAEVFMACVSSQGKRAPKRYGQLLGTLVITEIFWMYRGDHKLCFHALWWACSTCRWKLRREWKCDMFHALKKPTCMPFQARPPQIWQMLSPYKWRPWHRVSTPGLGCSSRRILLYVVWGRRRSYLSF